MRGVRVLEPMDVRDIGMVERRQQLRFAAEPAQTLWVVGEQVRENLDRDVTVQLGIAGPIDLTHTTGPEGRADFVRAEAGSERQRHRAPDDRAGADCNGPGPLLKSETRQSLAGSRELSR